MRRLLLLLWAVAVPASAQRLAYTPVEPAEGVAGGSPHLSYKRVEGDSHPARSGFKWRWGLVDRFEYAAQRGRDGYAWDFSAMIGGERDRIWLGTSGDGGFYGTPDYAETNLLYSRHLGGKTGYWDLNAGLRYDVRPQPSRAYAVLGAQYDDADKEAAGAIWFGAFAYLSHEGELSARVAGYYNRRLWKDGPVVLQPSAELDFYGEDVPELGLGRGVGYAEAGLRLRYELLDGLVAPYLGLSWSRDLGRTARMTREAGEAPETKSLVLGVRSEF